MAFVWVTLVLPGLYMIEQMLPSVINVLDLFIDFVLFGLVAGSDELFSKLFQMGFILTKEVDLLHAVLQWVCEREKRYEMNIIEMNIFTVYIFIYLCL